MIPLQSFRERLALELQKIEAGIIGLWTNSEIEEFRNDPDSGIVIIGRPSYSWKSLPDEHRAAQARAMERYRCWYEVFQRSHSMHASDVQREIEDRNKYVIAAIELDTSWQTEPTIDENQAYLSKELDFFRRLLCSQGPEPELILVPDTNAMLKSAKPNDYASTIDSKSFTFAIVPTVLAELDELKRSRRDQALGEKAAKAIRILKGLRAQGSVLDGVIVAKTIQVRMIPTEPRFQGLPSWLDPGNQDDRIIGSVLEIQFKSPSATVVLVTDDVNLQNKAEMAFLPSAEPPDVS